MKAKEKDTDQSLLEKIQSGDDSSFEILYKRYYQALCNYCFGMVNNEEAAKDIVTDCFVKLWNIRLHIRIEKSFRTYIFGFVHKRSLNYLRHRAIHLKYEAGELQRKITSEFAVGFNPLDYAEVSELEEKINKTIIDLPEKNREIFHLSRFENKTYQEIADQLDISISTVRTQMSRALEKLRNALKEFLP